MEVDLMICKYENCEKFLEMPICLPCGEVICKHHVKDQIADSNNKDIFDCNCCYEQHTLPKDGFPINKAVFKMINLNIHLKERHKHKLVKKELDELESFIYEYDKTSLTDAENYLYEYFSNIRNQLDLHRETLIKEINEKSDKILDELNKYEKECKNNIHQLSSYKVNIDHLKNDSILKWKEDLRIPNIQNDKLNNILLDMKNIKINIESQISQNKKDLLMNKDYQFMPVRSTQTNFGELIVTENNNNSVMQNNKMIQEEFGKCLMSFNGHTGAVTVILVIKELDRLISGAFDSTIKIWSISTGECLTTLNGHTKPISDLLAISNNHLISSSLDKTIILWDLNNPSLPLIIKTYKLNCFSSLCLINNNEFASGCTHGSLCLIEIPNLKLKKIKIVHKSTINRVKFISNSRLLTCSTDKNINIIDKETLNILKTLNGHGDSVSNLELTNDNYFLSGSWDGTIKIWSLSRNQNDAECVLTIPIGFKINDIKLIGLNTLAIAMFQNTNNLFIYDYSNHLFSSELKGHFGNVLGLDYFNESRKLFSCSADFSIKMWNV
jgi:WD40 repeat protein